MQHEIKVVGIILLSDERLLDLDMATADAYAEVEIELTCDGDVTQHGLAYEIANGTSKEFPQVRTMSLRGIRFSIDGAETQALDPAYHLFLSMGGVCVTLTDILFPSNLFG